MTTDALVQSTVAGMAVVIGSGFLLGNLSRRLKQPAVIGQILAGVILGPSLLGRLPGHVTAAVFPSKAVPSLSVVSQIALVLFLFAIGYELDLGVVARHSRAIPIVSVLAFGLPFLLGSGSTSVFGSLYSSAGGSAAHRPAFAVFIGIAMSITAVPVLAGILRERGSADSLPAVVAMMSAGIIDVVGWGALMVAVALNGHSSTAGGHSLSVTVVLFCGYLLGMVVLVRPALGWWLRRPGGRERVGSSLIAAVAMASAWVTAALGLHVIFGAFIAGVLTPRVRTATALVQPLRDAGDLLLPIFFVVSGLSMDVGALHAGDVALLAVICAIAISGKIGGGFLGSRASGLSGRDATVVGVLLNTRGLTELIVLNVGLQDGLLSRRLFTVLVIMALFTTALTSPLLSLMRFPSGAAPVGDAAALRRVPDGMHTPSLEPAPPVPVSAPRRP